MKNMRGSLASSGARRHLDAAVALVSIIPFLSLAIIGRVSFDMVLLSSWQWIVIALGVVGSPLLGYSLLLKYPATVLKLRAYLDEIVRGEIPDQIDLVRGETDIAAIECAMNLVLERLRSRADKAVAVSQRLGAELLQSRKLEAIGTLAAGIAHEINTPLQFIMSNLAFMQNELTGKAAKAASEDAVCIPDDTIDELGTCLSESQEGVRHIAGIVRAMSVFAKSVEDGVMKRINLNEAIESVVEVSRNAWKYEGQCKTDLDPCLPEVTCLPGEIKQVLMNLLINAVDAIKLKRASDGDEALGEIGIRTRTDGDNVIVTISDTGGGVSPANRDRVFEPFFTTDTTRRHHGQGLTLAYASVVERHDGNLSFESSAESGTTFSVQLPIDPGTPEPEVTVPQAAERVRP